MRRIISSESVFDGHPDKVCDQISDAILDEILKQDKHARVAVETGIKGSEVYIFGEVTTTAKIDYKALGLRTLIDIGYLDDFKVLSKIKSVLTTVNFKHVIKRVKTLTSTGQRKKTYYQEVADYMSNLENEYDWKSMLFQFVMIYEKSIAKEINRFLDFKLTNKHSTYNDSEISIVSDMHFNDIKDINKHNFSRNFNIVAGDFYNNIYHRGGKKIDETLDIKGIGVLGNHDVNWIDSVSDLEKEVKTNYKKSISNLKQAFPNIKILNNEIYYQNGIAFVGLTMVTDEVISDFVFKKRTFFANADLGAIFDHENYVETAKRLLDSIDPSTPIVLISHAPFKAYAVCKNKEIGVMSDRLLSKYPNIKIYIHGHGHSFQNKKVIDGILCITNPIVHNIYSDSVSTIKWDLT